MLLVNIVSLRKAANERINCGSRLNLLVAVKHFLAQNAVKAKVVQSAIWSNIQLIIILQLVRNPLGFSIIDKISCLPAMFPFFS